MESEPHTPPRYVSPNNVGLPSLPTPHGSVVRLAEPYEVVLVIEVPALCDVLLCIYDVVNVLG